MSVAAGLWEKAWACVLRDARIDVSYRIAFLLDAIDGLLMVLAYAVLARLFGGTRPDGFDALGFLLVGIAVNGALMTALACFAQAIRGVQAAGAIKAVLVTPTSPLTVVALSSVYPIARALVDVLVWLLAAWVCGVSFSHANPGGALLVFGVAALAMAGLGFVSAAFAVVFKRGDPVLWFFGALSLLLGGVLYPTSTLPPAVADLSVLLPATHALNALRPLLLDGASLSQVMPALLSLTAFAVVGVPVGLFILGASIRYAREKGTLGHV